MSYGRSVVQTIGAVEIMDDALFFPWCVVDWERCLDRWCQFSFGYRDAWLGGACTVIPPTNLFLVFEQATGILEGLSVTQLLATNISHQKYPPGLRLYSNFPW
jgi:hypothetical protein